MQLLKNGGYLICHSCSLKTVFLDEPALNKKGIETDVHDRDFYTETPKIMIAHIKEHFKKNKAEAKQIIKNIKQSYSDLNKPIQ